LQQPVPPLAPLAGALPSDLAGLIERCLSKRAKKRPSLRKLLQGLAAHARDRSGDPKALFQRPGSMAYLFARRPFSWVLRASLLRRVDAMLGFGQEFTGGIGEAVRRQLAIVEATRPLTEEALARWIALSRLRKESQGAFDAFDARRIDFANLTLCGRNLSELCAPNVQWPGRDLSGASLNRADLAHARLDGANLEGADLRRADLRGALAAGARLARARMERINMEGADLSEAALPQVFLRGAKLARARLAGAELRGADLTEASLRGAEMTGADLREVIGPASNLRGATLNDADLRGARLDAADLRSADLSSASLGGASLKNADLRGAALFLADLSGCDLTGAKLEDADLELCRYDTKTRWPAGIAPSAPSPPPRSH
ncbi:MAG: pentapeptide repeat-containing protein, partial [Planctomycetota bacterium]